MTLPLNATHILRVRPAAGGLALLTGLSLLAPPAPAQVQTLPEVVVSASRVPVPSREVGSAVSVITADQLERSQNVMVSDALRRVPGLAVSRTSGLGSTTQVRIRGAEANHTLVLIDGIEVNDVSAGSEFEFSDLVTADVERIEVLRGPQSALWGSDAIGGVVNVITRKGQGAPTGSASLEGGSFDTVIGRASLGGGGQRHHFALGGAWVQSDGISDANERRGNPEEDDYQNTTAYIKGGITPWQNLDIDIVGRFTRADDETDNFIAVVGATDDRRESEIKHRYGRVQGRLDLFDGVWEQILGATISDDERDNFTRGARNSLFDGERTKFDYQSNIRFQTTAVAEAEHTITLAAEREEEKVVSASVFANVDREIENDAYIGEYRLGLWQRLFLSGSLRYDDNDVFDDETTYRATAAYLNEGTATRLHGSVGEGVKNPTLFELFGFTSTFTGNPNLTPETATGWDLGVEQSLFDGRAVIDVTYFETDTEDLIQGAGPTAVNVAGTTELRGVEVTGTFRPLPMLGLSAAYTYTLGQDANDTELVRRPKHLASFNADYDFELLNRPGNLSFNVEFHGERTDFQFYPFFNPLVVRLESYTLVSLAGAWSINDTFQIFGRVQNLLDQDYEEVLSFGTPGRAAYLGLRARF